MAVMFGAAALAIVVPHALASEDAHHVHHADVPMSDEAMAKWVADWYASHPRVGVAAPRRVTDATVSVLNFRFEADGNAGTQVDTVKILVGESVTWEIPIGQSGSHTVTSGTGPTDPQAGALFDQPVTSVDPSFTLQFASVGTVPYFCRPHSGFNMRGIVVVSSGTGVTPLPAPAAAAGFTRPPRPNPTRRGVDFQFALTAAGRARVEVFDARGARVAVVSDRDLAAGTYAARWDGTRDDGGAAAAGVYYLRLRLPGVDRSRVVVVAR